MQLVVLELRLAPTLLESSLTVYAVYAFPRQCVRRVVTSPSLNTVCSPVVSG
jgi:hypothetical protein